jgi:Ca2+-binding EF-hand superfamily protein
MVSELRRRKMVGMFNATDVNKNGVLDREDFLLCGAKYAAHNGWADGTPESDGMRDFFAGWWDGFSAAADADKDGAVSADEFVTAFTSFDRDTLAPAAMVLFDAVDPSGDGVITPAEYRSFLAIYQVDAPRADEVFARLDLDGDGQVSRDEFASLWMEFCFSEDESSPGNWLFGPY